MTSNSDGVRSFILQNVDSNPSSIVSKAAEKFSITRQAAHRHLRSLIDGGYVRRTGTSRKPAYELVPLASDVFRLPLSRTTEENVIWRERVRPLLEGPPNVMGLWQYGITEMINNAVDHSGGSHLIVSVRRTAASTRAIVMDDGEGIFRKLQRLLNLEDERHALLELAKGKLTTDPERHTGEGIFFTSRMFTRFAIRSGGVYFSHDFECDEDWILESEHSGGTDVHMLLRNDVTHSTEDVFNRFAGEDEDYGFVKTVVPVRLARYGDELLVSRSQAKRLMARVDRFRMVLLDFSGIESIGRAFADEVFRVFAQRNPHTVVLPINANETIVRMSQQAKSGIPSTPSDLPEPPGGQER